jgi:hypothetical protein
MTTSNIPNSTKDHTINGLLHRTTVDTDSEDELAAPKSWTVEFEGCVKTAEAMVKDMDIVDLWGVNDYPF